MECGKMKCELTLQCSFLLHSNYNENKTRWKQSLHWPNCHSQSERVIVNIKRNLRKRTFLTKIIKDFRPEACYYSYICTTMWFLRSLLSCNFDDKLSQMIHQVKILVFDNIIVQCLSFQLSLVSINVLKTLYTIGYYS